jgi:hypothetical protein
MSRPAEDPAIVSFCQSLEEDSTEILQQIGRLRIRAWLYHGGEMPPAAKDCGDVWLDSHDEHAQHWIVKRGERVVAAARACIHATGDGIPDPEAFSGYLHRLIFPVAFFNRLVVDPSASGNQFARLLDLARIDFAGKNNAKSIVVVTHVPCRIRQLYEQGFITLGESTYPLDRPTPSLIVLKRLH